MTAARDDDVHHGHRLTVGGQQLANALRPLTLAREENRHAPDAGMRTNASRLATLLPAHLGCQPQPSSAGTDAPHVDEQCCSWFHAAHGTTRVRAARPPHPVVAPRCANRPGFLAWVVSPTDGDSIDAQVDSGPLALRRRLNVASTDPAEVRR